MYCPKCGCEYREGFNKCSDCGVDLVNELAEVDLKIINEKKSIYASLPGRIGALIIDSIIVLMLISPLLYIFIKYLATRDEMIYPPLITLISGILELIPYWLYNSLFESSKNKGTIGKMLFGIIVVDYQGNRLSFKKSTIRTFSKLISLFFVLGFFIALSSEKKQSIHDNIAKTLVLYKGKEFKLSDNNNDDKMQFTT